MGAANWTVEDVDFHARYQFASPAPGQQGSFGSLSFTLVNEAAGTRTACAARSTKVDQFFYGTVWYDCGVDVGGEGDGDDDSNSPHEGSVRASLFRFDRPTGLLEVNQTWGCGEGGI